MNLSTSSNATTHARGLLYTKMKIFHFKDKLDTLSRENSDIMAPLHIRIKPTNACNHNCRYCAYRVGNLQLGKDMVDRDYIPKDKMMQIIGDLDQMRVKAITFSGGGEPFCYPYLLDTVKKIAKTGIRFASLTNGSRLKGELSEAFAHNAAWVRISIDGWDDESYSGYRGVAAGEFSKVMENMTNFTKLGGECYLSACIIVNRTNAPHVYELIERLRDTGLNSVKVAPCIVSNEGSQNNEYHEPIFSMVKEQVSKAIDKFAGETFEVSDSYHEQLDTFKKSYNWCPYLQILPIIGADLNIYPCQDKAYNLEEGLIGSIKDKNFKDFWFQNKDKFFKVNPSECCNHHCVANSKNTMILEYLEADRKHLSFV